MGVAAVHLTYTTGRSKRGLFEDGSRKAAKKTANVKRMHADAAR